MAVRKKCKDTGCKSSPRCDHPWWFTFTHNQKRYRMTVNEFALARGAKLPVTTKAEAEKTWEPLFIGEVMAGKDPHVSPVVPEGEIKTVAQLLSLYDEKYVDVEPLKSKASIKSRLKTLKAHLGTLPVKALERAAAIDDLKRGYVGRKQATLNRLLGQLRAVVYWAMGRGLLDKTPFSRGGVRINKKGETQRQRRVSRTEETALLAAADAMKTAAHKKVGAEMRARIIGALETGCRQGEMLKIQNRDIDWDNHSIRIRAENAKDDESRTIPFEPKGRLAAVLKPRRFLGAEGYVFGAADGSYVKDFRSAFASLVLLANGIDPIRPKHGARVNAKELQRINLHWHDLRHEAPSRWLEQGLDLRSIQLLLGHASITTTQRYLNLTDEGLTTAMRKTLWKQEEAGNGTGAEQEAAERAAAVG